MYVAGYDIHVFIDFAFYVDTFRGYRWFCGLKCEAV